MSQDLIDQTERVILVTMTLHFYHSFSSPCPTAFISRPQADFCVSAVPTVQQARPPAAGNAIDFTTMAAHVSTRALPDN